MLTSVRNKICFTGKPANYQLQLCNNMLKYVLIILNNIFIDNVLYTIQVSDTNQIGLEILSQKDIIITDMDIFAYIKLNNIIIKYEIFNDICCGIPIKRSPISFHQNDDEIRKKVHNIFTCLSSEKLLCIGGECYIFGQLFKKTNIIHIYSDYDSIILDAIINNETAICKKINYDSFIILHSYDTVILNIGKKGCSANMLKQLLNNV